MSSDEESHSGSESEEEVVKRPLKREVSETELAMQKRREAQKQNTSGLDDAAKELLASNRQDRERMEDEINELRLRNERRKKEREIEEKRLAAERAAEDERRKAAEETKRKQKTEEEERRQKERAKKLAELEKMRNPPKPNFVITKKSGSESEEEEEDDRDETTKNRKSKQQLEDEKRAILSQRVKPLEISGFNPSKLVEKAKELHSIIYKLEGEKYDLEKHFKAQQFDMMELAERARQINKVGKGGLKRIQQGPDDPVDKIQEKFAGTPAKIEMYSKYERQKDKRDYVERLGMFKGPQFSYPPERIRPTKIVAWDEEGMPIYSSSSNGHAHEDDK